MRSKLFSAMLGLLFMASPTSLPALALAAPATDPMAAPVATWYFADGSTQPPFDTWFLVQNPTNQPSAVRFTFHLQGGGTITRDFTAGPTSRFSVYANQVLPNQAFSTRIDADQAVLAERAMYVGYDGTAVTGISGPNKTWLFAEGSTQSPFHTWLLLQNPNGEAASATVTYLLDAGRPPAIQSVVLPPNSRTSIFVNQVLPNSAFASRVESSLPIVVERAMYRFPGNAATAKSGVNAASRTWYFADGRRTFSSSQGADTWLLLQNPDATPVVATVTLYSFDGQTTTFERTLPPASRQSIPVSQISPFDSFGIRVQASNEIIAERSVFVASPSTGGEPRGAYATTGARELGRVWAFPEGSSAPPFNEYIAVVNPNDQPTHARFEFMVPDGTVFHFDTPFIPPNSRIEVPVGAACRCSAAAISTRVTTDLPTVAERVMWFSKGGNQGFTDAIGIRMQ